MLIPQFTIRWMFGLTAVMAVLFLVISWAVQGSAWAIGVSAAVVALAIAAIVYAAMFALVWLLSLKGLVRPTKSRATSPPEIH